MSPPTDGASATDGGHQHHVLDHVAAALTVPIEVAVSVFTTSHHDSWEDAVARYDHDHPAAASSMIEGNTSDRPAGTDGVG